VVFHAWKSEGCKEGGQEEVVLLLRLNAIGIRM
jgi:hypothetical protein